jgi:hypothetical protein
MTARPICLVCFCELEVGDDGGGWCYCCDAAREPEGEWITGGSQMSDP